MRRPQKRPSPRLLKMHNLTPACTGLRGESIAKPNLIASPDHVAQGVAKRQDVVRHVSVIVLVATRLELGKDVDIQLDVAGIGHRIRAPHLRVQAAKEATAPPAATSATQQVPEAEAIEQLHSPAAKQQQVPEADAVEHSNER